MVDKTDAQDLCPAIDNIMLAAGTAFLPQIVNKFESGVSIDGNDHKTVHSITDRAHGEVMREAVLQLAREGTPLSSDLRAQLGLAAAPARTAPALGFSKGMQGLGQALSSTTPKAGDAELDNGNTPDTPRNNP